MNFWSDKKEGFVRIKEWEEKRRATMFKNKKILVSMLQRLVAKLRNSANENVTFLNYFSSLITTELEYAEKIRKQVRIFETIRKPYQTRGLAYNGFLVTLQEFEQDYALKKEQFTKDLRDIVSETVKKNQTNLKKFLEKCAERFDELHRQVVVEERKVDKTYNSHVNTFNDAEHAFLHSKGFDKDLWLSEDTYIKATQEHAAK